MNDLTQGTKLALGLIEGGLTLSGVIAAITPLVLWTAWSELIFYWILSVGCGAFLSFIGLAWLRGLLAPDAEAGGAAFAFESLRQRRINWERLHREDPRVAPRRRPIKGDARREVGYMLRIASALILFAALLFLAVWALMEFRYG